ncbi:capsular biosynthesis protein [Methylobacterium sp. J-092]|uniref:capsular biosynthesis protein n=1 Tax=Methylobacterium sp. J-092 TaxID=2836667 RepID=UPI001FB90128|nr:capsular biosynthesis protein [Methylobacterium sp. J-092]MCJ2006269.1 capsular biosynthesis protein [Methylobacterium sp. J-092]
MIVIPMAGLSSRFTAAGYDRPKYMLSLHGSTVFAHAVGSFSALFSTTPFLFIGRPIMGTESFLRAECATLGIADARIVMLDHETSGQAESVELGFLRAGAACDEPMTIFNIDTFRKDFAFPDALWYERSAGYLEVFRGTGANWSYVGPEAGADEPLVARTTEKDPISDLCCNGLYHFAAAKDFLWALSREREAPSAPELYVAPLYNRLIAIGKRIHYRLVSTDRITFCGVPSEYEALLQTERPRGADNRFP